MFIYHRPFGGDANPQTPITVSLMSIWKYANPVLFTATSKKIRRVLFWPAVILTAVGLIWGFFFTPPDYQQGASVKIMYIHVPAAMLAVNIWFMMLITSLIWLIRRHHVSALAAKAAAPIGAVMLIASIVTGALWGSMTWGTYWVWDPRLTSFFVLLLFYLGYIALWSAIDDPDLAADLTAILCIVGSLFAFLSRYAVLFWNQGLHQAASFSMDKEENVADVFFYPALFTMAGFILGFIVLVLYRTESEIMSRRLRALRLRDQDTSTMTSE